MFQRLCHIACILDYIVLEDTSDIYQKSCQIHLSQYQKICYVSYIRSYVKSHALEVMSNTCIRSYVSCIRSYVKCMYPSVRSYVKYMYPSVRSYVKYMYQKLCQVSCIRSYVKSYVLEVMSDTCIIGYIKAISQRYILIHSS